MSARCGFFGRGAALPALRDVEPAAGAPRRMLAGAARSDRLGWLRAALLWAQDGIVATATLLVGVAAAGVGRGDLPIVGLACLAAGALAMAVGEYLAASPHASEDADRRPLRMAFASAGAFAGGASLPLLVALVAPIAQLVGWLVATSLFFLCALAATAASAGRSPLGAGLRAALWGGAAMAGAAAVGSFSGPLV